MRQVLRGPLTLLHGLRLSRYSRLFPCWMLVLLKRSQEKPLMIGRNLNYTKCNELHALNQRQIQFIALLRWQLHLNSFAFSIQTFVQRSQALQSRQPLEAQGSRERDRLLTRPDRLLCFDRIPALLACFDSASRIGAPIRPQEKMNPIMEAGVHDSFSQTCQMICRLPMDRWTDGLMDRWTDGPMNSTRCANPI